ncbi:MAG: hypothetical protein E6G08_01570 [Actinobacteria bacterium]|nr:MAG: hypothetical protein E6G08_01570 [Actinomycetota bacterium]
MDRRARAHGLVAVSVLERGRRDLLGHRRRPRRVLRGTCRRGCDQPVRPLRGRRDRRRTRDRLARRPLRQEAARGTTLKRLLFVVLVALVLTAPAAGAAPNVPTFGHVVVVVFENHELSDVLGTSNAPTFNALAHRFASIDDYLAVTHPSLPNYLALVSGSTQGISNDCTHCTASGRSLADTLEAARKSWKTYAEGLPSPGFDGAFSGRYAKKHNPFMYFPSVVSNPTRRSRIVAFPQFAADVRARRLPTFSLVVPDLCNDMRLSGRHRRYLAQAPDRPVARERRSRAQCRVRDLRRRFVRQGRRRQDSGACTRAAGQAWIASQSADLPLRAAADDRGRARAATARRVADGEADRRHLALIRRKTAV